MSIWYPIHLPAGVEGVNMVIRPAPIAVKAHPTMAGGVQYPVLETIRDIDRSSVMQREAIRESPGTVGKLTYCARDTSEKGL